MQNRPVFSAAYLISVLDNIKSRHSTNFYCLIDIEQRVMLKFDIHQYQEITIIGSYPSDNIYGMLDESGKCMGVFDLNQVGGVVDANTFVTSGSSFTMPDPLDLTVINGINDDKLVPFVVSSSGSYVSDNYILSKNRADVNDWMAYWNDRISTMLGGTLIGTVVACKVIIKGLQWERIDWIYFLNETAGALTISPSSHSPFYDQIELHTAHMPSGYIEREKILSSNLWNNPQMHYPCPVRIEFNFQSMTSFDVQFLKTITLP